MNFPNPLKLLGGKPEPHPEPQPDYQALLAENAALRNQYSYDNEWIKFLGALAENDSIKDIVEFINATKWTDRQKSKIMAYSKIMLGRGLATTYITGIKDYQRLYDDFNLVDCLLPLGMTRFDITPEFNLLIAMIKMHFGIESRRSKGGDFIDKIGKQTTELRYNDNRKDADGFKQKITGVFKG